MKKQYFFLLFIATFQVFYGQTACDDANSELVYAYSHVKSSYSSNNIDHLKYYANRSLESFERTKKELKECGCETAYNLAYDSAELLKKVESAETYEDGRFFVKRAREIAQQTITELDKCTIPVKDNVTNEELTSLQIEQEKLKQQQEELKRRSEEIKLKMAEQKEMELKLKKEELINSYKSVMSSNLETYNNALKICDCSNNLLALEDNNSSISEKSVEEIKSYYLSSLKGLTTNYLAKLNSCN